MTRLVLLVAALAIAWGPAEARVHRSGRVLREYQILHPCPSTGLRRGPCPGWQKDHIWALECGGPDTVENLQWLTVKQHQVKTRADNARCRWLARRPSVGLHP